VPDKKGGKHFGIEDYTHKEKQRALDEAAMTDAERIATIKQYVESSLMNNIHPILNQEELIYLLEQAGNTKLKTDVDIALRNLRKGRTNQGITILSKAIERY